MDSATPTLPMPPSPGASAFIPPSAQGFAAPPQAPQAPQMQQQVPRPVGRPNGDPEVQEQRQERSALRQRLKNILPASMTDGKIAIFKLEGRKGRNKASARPVMTILFRDLERALEDGVYKDTGEFVEDKLIEKYGERGRFLWEAQDNRGRSIPEAGETEIDLSDGADENDNQEGDNVDDNDDQNQNQDEPAQFFQHAPPPPPFDPAVHARTVREIITEEKKGAESMVTVLMTMMQSQAQQQQLAMQQQMQQAEARRQEEDRRRDHEEAKEREERKIELERMRLDQERRDKEEQRREEREKDRRIAEQQMQMTLFQAMFNRPDTTTPMLMKMIESKGDRDGMKDMFGLMSEASKQAMVTQGEATKHMLSAQAEASKTLMANVMGISQTMVEQMVQSQAEPTDDPMEKIGRVFKMIAPALSAMNTGTQQAAVPQQRIAQQGQPVQQAAPQQVPPAEYIKGGLYTIMRLETGEIPIAKRFMALKWCADNLPKPMLDAIRSGVENNVMTIGAQGMDERLIGWISEDAHADFMRECIKDIQRILLGALTQGDAKASLEKHAAYMQAKANGGQQQAPQQDDVIPAEVDAATVAQPVAENGKRRAPPPSDKPLEADESIPAAGDAP